MNNRNKILIVGLFVSPQNKNLIYRTAADQLAEVLCDNNYGLIKTSTKVNKVFRALDIITTIILKSWSYKIAIVPFYGSSNAFIIEKWSTKILNLLGKKIVLIVHGGGMPIRLRNNPEKYLTVFKNVNQVVCPSPYLQMEILKYGIESIVIENVVKLSDYNFVAKETFAPKLLWMRAFSDIYNPLMAVRVLDELKKTMPEATMVMAGKDLGNLEEVKQLASQLNLQKSISYPGYIHAESKNEIAHNTDIYICTNKVDNAPVTFIEMMALGLPVVSVNIGGIPYIVNNQENGLLVNAEDAVGMSKEIIKLIQDPSLGKYIVQNGLKTARLYDENIVVEKWKKLFIKLENKA